jgi:hypothetical protein
MSNPPVRPGSEEEWQELLHQLRQQAKKPPRPFFYARVQARLTAEMPAARAWLPGWARRPAYVVVLSMLVLAVRRDGAALRPVAVTQDAGYQANLPAILAR